MDAYPSDAERQARADSLQALEAQITELAGHLNAAHYRFLKLLAEFDQRKGWSGAALQSCAHWLNWKCGIDLGAARREGACGARVGAATEHCCSHGMRPN